MFFQRRYNNKKNNSSLSCELEPASSRRDSTTFGERISSFTSNSSKGSLTVEAALILPLYLIACISLLFLIEIFRIHNSLQYSMSQAGQSLSQAVSLIQMNDDSNYNEQFPILNKGMSVFTIQEIVLDNARKNQTNFSYISGGENGVLFLLSSYSKEWIDIVLYYKVKIPLALIPLPSIPFLQRFRIRAWTGADVFTQEEYEDEQMVYITEYGTVYHTSLDCTYLKLSIQSVPYLSITSLRNNGGAKYYACERCTKHKNPEPFVYITNDGTCFHYSISCSSLKRTVQKISLSNVGTRTCCKKCASKN